MTNESTTKSQVKILDNSIDAFFALLRAGIWEQGVRLFALEPVDVTVVYRIASEQSVVGLITAGLEHVEDVIISKQELLPFLKTVISSERRNVSMNSFISKMVEKMHSAGIFALIVKGQGVAQCYERPQWRAAGDIDFFLDAENYEKAKAFLTPIATSHETENVAGKHIAMTIGPWVVELHGTLSCGLSARMDKEIAVLQKETFLSGDIRVWHNGATDIFLPGVDNDIIFIFTHFLKHFYKGGLGLRQICDWCRLLWTYRATIDVALLDSRLRSMRLMIEWKAFAMYAVLYLGMPIEAMPLYEGAEKWVRKARRINRFVIEVGNFGHNRNMSYYSKYPYFIRKSISAWWRFADLCSHARIFPLNSMRFLPSILFNGLRSAVRGE